MEQLEESKTKIEGLLDWISNVGKEKGDGDSTQKEQTGTENGNLPMETTADDANGNALDTTDNQSIISNKGKDSSSSDLDKQSDRVKVNKVKVNYINQFNSYYQQTKTRFLYPF